MPEVTIVIDVPDEDYDRDDPTGLTEEAHDAISVALSPYGDIVDFREGNG